MGATIKTQNNPQGFQHNFKISLDQKLTPYLNQATPKSTCQTSLPPKLPESKISNPQKIIRSSLSLEIWSLPWATKYSFKLLFVCQTKTGHLGNGVNLLFFFLGSKHQISTMQVRTLPGNLIVVSVPFSLHCSRHAIKTAAKETRFHCITPVRVL